VLGPADNLIVTTLVFPASTCPDGDPGSSPEPVILGLSAAGACSQPTDNLAPAVVLQSPDSSWGLVISAGLDRASHILVQIGGAATALALAACWCFHLGALTRLGSFELQGVAALTGLAAWFSAGALFMIHRVTLSTALLSLLAVHAYLVAFAIPDLPHLRLGVGLDQDLVLLVLYGCTLLALGVFLVSSRIVDPLIRVPLLAAGVYAAVPLASLLPFGKGISNLPLHVPLIEGWSLDAGLLTPHFLGINVFLLGGSILLSFELASEFLRKDPRRFLRLAALLALCWVLVASEFDRADRHDLPSARFLVRTLLQDSEIAR